MKNFKVRFKNLARREKLNKLKEQCAHVSGFMTIYELIQYHSAEHIMDYKLLLSRMNKRLKNLENDRKTD